MDKALCVSPTRCISIKVLDETLGPGSRLSAPCGKCRYGFSSGRLLRGLAGALHAAAALASCDATRDRLPCAWQHGNPARTPRVSQKRP